MDTTHQTIATGDTASPMLVGLQEHELDEELRLGARAWIDNNVDPRVYVDGPDWPELFGETLAQVLVAADDAKERRADDEARFWALVQEMLGSVLTHQADGLGIDDTPEKYVRFHEASGWWNRSELPALPIVSAGWR